MPVRKAWLPREGFTADVVARIIRNTALNPAVTLPLLLLATYTSKGREISLDHETAVRRVKFLLYIGIVRLVNRYLSRGAQNNWTSAEYVWNKEIAVVTGGSDGIGKNIALLLAEQGVKVASLDIRPPNYEPGPNIKHYTCDITSPSFVSEVANTVRSDLGHPTLLINNAGIATGKVILTSTEESVQRTFAVNTLSHYRLAREFLPSMVKANHGTVVTVASVAASISTANIVDYSSSKSAALAFHEGLAVELRNVYKAPKVRTICLCPSIVQTSLTTQLKETKDSFLMPVQRVESVADKVVEKIFSGDSGVVVIPEAGNWLGWPVRALPMWWQTFIRNSAGKPMEGLGRAEDVEKVLKGKI